MSTPERPCPAREGFHLPPPPRGSRKARGARVSPSRHDVPRAVVFETTENRRGAFNGAATHARPTQPEAWPASHCINAEAGIQSGRRFSVVSKNLVREGYVLRGDSGPVATHHAPGKSSAVGSRQKARPDRSTFDSRCGNRTQTLRDSGQGRVYPNSFWGSLEGGIDG